MLLVIVWVVGAIILGAIANSNGDSFGGWTFVGLVIDPIVAGFVYFLYRLMFK